MKFKSKFIIAISAIILSTLIFTACQKQANVKNEDSNDAPENITISKATNQDLVNTLTASFQSYRSMISKIDQNISLNDINFDNTYISTIKDSEGEALAINLKASNANNIQYAFMLTKREQKLASQF